MTKYTVTTPVKETTHKGKTAGWNLRNVNKVTFRWTSNPQRGRKDKSPLSLNNGKRLAMTTHPQSRSRVKGQLSRTVLKTSGGGDEPAEFIRWKNDRVIWLGLEAAAIIDLDNGSNVRHGLSSPVKYCRIIRRYLNGKRRWFVQLVLEGIPYQKSQNYIGDGLIGLDINVSNIAFVADNYAGLLPFAEGVPTFTREITALQRRMQRSQRANNPDNFEPDTKARQGRKTVVKKGKPKKGKRQWKNSSNYRKAARKKREA